jgi:hypothetical protein
MKKEKTNYLDKLKKALLITGIVFISHYFSDFLEKKVIAQEPGVAVAFSSGLGDGTYPVYAKMKVIPGFGLRVTEVRIMLIGQR